MDRVETASGHRVVVMVALVSIVAAVWASQVTQNPSPTAPAAGVIRVTDLSARLGATFHPGAIQGFGANGSAVLLAGISIWDRASGTSLPELATLAPDGSIANSTSVLGDRFRFGGVFGTVWNGTDWMVSGEATWGSLSGGVLYSWTGSRWANLTPSVAPFFTGGGVWAVGWNGSGWLVAGNSTAGATLGTIDAGGYHDLTSRIPNNFPGALIQLLAWNGDEWLVGGLGVFGALAGESYHDLLPSSEYREGGVFAADWNGSAWLVGGAPAALETVRADVVSPAPALPYGFSEWVNAIVWTHHGWLIGGKGGPNATRPGASAPELAFWPGAGAVVDLSRFLPSTFWGGQVQFAAWAPLLGPTTVLVVGQGHLDPVSGRSDGCLATIEIG